MKHLILFITITLLMETAVFAADLPQPPIVRVQVTYQAYEAHQPWQKEKPQHRYGYGVVLTNGTILTTESLIRNHQLVELQKARSGTKIQAHVVISDWQANLAILKPLNTNDLVELPSLSLAEQIPEDANLEILQLDETRELQRGDGTVIRILVDALPSAPSQLLLFKILTDLNVDGEGAAVVVEDGLAGLMISYDRSSRTGMMIPHSVLKQFIDDCSDSTYEGFASAGIIWKPLIDPARRRFLDVKDPDAGIQIVSCLPGTYAADVLLPNDVITQWDSVAVDSLGYYMDPNFGRLLFPHLIKGNRKPGDSVPVTLIRDAQETNVTVTLVRTDDSNALIPENITQAPIPYLIEGGLVMRELTGRYLRTYGSDWKLHVDSRVAHIYSTRRWEPEKKGDRIVILDAVLPDTINIGYQHMRAQIIQKANGETIRNMADLFRIANRDGFITRLTFQSMGLDVVLDKASLPESNQRLMEQYRIPALRREQSDTENN